MTASTKDLATPAVFGLPNQLTTLRLALAVVLFVLMSFKFYQSALIVFMLAAATDWLDGFLARKYGLITTLGRILDPFADKIVVCGTFILLAAIPEMQRYLPAWMVVVIVGRELLVTALRSFLEQQGQDFSAVMSGKLKMGLQCAAAMAALVFLSYEPGEAQTWLVYTLHGTIWAAVLLTVYSGVAYVRTAIGLLSA
ncbi:MAG TPA: CDP-diacylglycerol--glycerol-3-phosphate 3-phosphatidyltransferase [Pirellulales bacterium]|jgi:CDP-diacylglycerol--glycerol-3-phosphate 3-phosphatidyltransferase